MIIPSEKIKVFISSMCGEENGKQKYNIVREALKVLIESTGFAKVYAFESEGASTISARNHYTFNLEKSDVCIFLIDNKDGVSKGVQEEIDIANKHNIKSFYYFCDEYSKEKTPLQKSIEYADHSISTPIHEFKDIIEDGATDLINDLVLVYKSYCKPSLKFIEEPQTEQSMDISNIKLSNYSENITPKTMLSNIDKCIDYYTKLIFGRSSDEVKNTNEIDNLCVSFLPVVFEGTAINNDILDLLLLKIEKYQTPNHFNITRLRYAAIKEYFTGNQDDCIKNLEDALHEAKQKDLPEWLINDILIDLRNQDAILNETKNTIDFNSKYQKEIQNSEFLLHYPLLDRLTSNYFEGIIEEVIKYKTKSPETITIIDGLEKHIKSLANIYVMAMHNGSLTQLRLMYERIKYFTFYCALRYPDWNIKMALLKNTLIDGNKTETEGILRCFGDLHKMNANDAYEIYSYTNNIPINHQKFIAKLEAFRITSYYLNDLDFNNIWSELYENISLWIKDKNSVVRIGGHIFSAIEGSYLRISQDQLIEIICKCVRNNNRRFYDDIFKIIRRCVNLEEASPDHRDDLLDIIINIVRNSDERKEIPYLNSVLCTLRKRYRTFTNDLDKVIAEEMPDFYEGNYFLETTNEDNIELSKFIEKFITQIRLDNEEQGKNGHFFGRGTKPHITIKNILQDSNAKFSEDLINSAFKASCDTLLTETQTVITKMDAIELLVYMLKSHPNTKEHNKNELGILMANKTKLEKAHSIMTNLDEVNLRFSLLLLYNCIGDDIIAELLEILADISRDFSSNIKASEDILNYLDADKSAICDIRLEYIFLHQAIKWTIEENVNIRWNAVQILLSLIKHTEIKNIVCNQLVKLMDIDNLYIKNQILRNIHLIKDIDIKTYDYIIQKAEVDSNYVVRKVVKEICK